MGNNPDSLIIESVPTVNAVLIMEEPVNETTNQWLE